jgi:CHAD domain-containing protein
VERLTALQDLLGAHQDDVVARERLRRLAAASARTDRPGGPLSFVLGVLHERATGSDEVAYLAARRLVRDARRHWPA